MTEKYFNFSLLSRNKFSNIFVWPLTISCCILAGNVFIRHVTDAAVLTQKNNLLSHVRTLSGAVNVDDIKALSSDQTDSNKPQYVRLRNQLKGVVRENPSLRFAYLMSLKDGEVVFLADNEEENSEDYSPPGQIYQEASQELRLLFSGADGFVEGPLRDRWGNWISALVPVKDRQANKVIAVLGLDVNYATWDKEVANDRKFARLIAILFSVILLLSVYFIQRQRGILNKMLVSQERFKNVADITNEWIWEVDINGIFKYSSHAVRNILGYDPDEIIGKKSVYEFSFPEDREKIIQAVKDDIAGSQFYISRVERWKHRDDREVTLEIKGLIIRDEKGKAVSCQGVSRDITEIGKKERMIQEKSQALESANLNLAANEKALREMLDEMAETNRQLQQTQDQLIQTEKMATVGVLASGVAHEIKNPLAIILQGIERVEKIFAKSGDTAAVPFTTMVKDAAVRANKVVNALLQFSRSSRLELKTLDMRQIIDAAVLLVEARAKACAIKIRCNYAQDDIFVNGDNILLEQVFFDLFMNAIDAMPNGGEIVIVTRVKLSLEKKGKSKEVIIEIKDSGCGIAPENIPKAFDPFFTTKEPGKGTGLGLSTAYLILERHNGSIGLESQVGVGTTVVITLPSA
ncbi:MAG TPA: ATP-binding protein [Candidatus Omnitrophota bacterium]|nr:ATP-binding protein [Candidatus Omnitrophota bacterium]HPD85158.1 ATP-binding protein [Candidatus Omnitrophota bacterium]HRZ04341.1 ATP-binding protein [Candidatus Omnitrophota bacterium]